MTPMKRTSALLCASVTLVCSVSRAESLSLAVREIQQFGTSTGDGGWSVTTGPTGDVYIAGVGGEFIAGTGQGNFDGFVSKHDSNGSLQWIASYGTAAYDVASGALADGDGNVYVSWTSATGGNLDGHLSKFDSQGNQLWSQTFDINAMTSTSGMAFDHAGNILLTGSTWSEIGSSATTDAFVANYSPNGVFQQSFKFGSQSFDRPESIAVDSQGNIILAGLTEGALGGSNAGFQDAFVAKLSPISGESLWIRQFGSGSNERNFDVATDASDNILFTGTGAQVGDNAFGDWDAFIGKLDPSGNTTWLHQFGTSSADWSEGLVLTAAGDAFVAGHTRGDLYGQNAGPEDLIVAGFNSAGTQIAEWQFGGSGRDTARSISISPDSSVLYITGNTSSTLGGGVSAGSDDVFLVMLVVPEPTSLGLLATGAILAFSLRRRAIGRDKGSTCGEIGHLLAS